MNKNQAQIKVRSVLAAAGRAIRTFIKKGSTYIIIGLGMLAGIVWWRSRTKKVRETSEAYGKVNNPNKKKDREKSKRISSDINKLMRDK